jgi:hypothetical protein
MFCSSNRPEDVSGNDDVSAVSARVIVGLIAASIRVSSFAL